MKGWKRNFALLLALVLLLGLLPMGSFAEAQPEEAADEPYVFTEEDNALIDNDVFALIADVEAEEIKPVRGKTPTPEDYVKILPQVIEAIEASETYVEGSLVRNGNFIWWRTTNGMACGFDPYMEAVDHGWQDPAWLSDAEEPQTCSQLSDLENGVTGTRAGSSAVKEIGLIQPYWDNNDSDDGWLDENFKTRDPIFKAKWEELNETTGGTATYRYTLSNATVDNLAKCLTDCALVIVNSHGVVDATDENGKYDPLNSNTSYIMLTTTNGLTEEDYKTVTGPHGSYSHAIKLKSGHARVDGTCIANHMSKNAPGSMLFLGLCYGMATDGIFKPLRDKGVEVVFGYSRPVTFFGNTTYMEAMMDQIKAGKTAGEAIESAKKDYGNWDPCYNDKTLEWMQTNNKAFPIMVSKEDAYPGQANVQNVFTFSSTWKLTDVKPALTGTVSVTPAAPVYGDKMWYSLGGEAQTLQQNGVAFTVVWERSDNGETGWTAFTGGPHTANANDIGKYLRVRVSADGYAGYLYSSPVLVTKAACTTPVAIPQLWGSGTNVSVTNSKSNQEYIILNYKKDKSNLTASDWASAKTGTDGSLTLSGSANSVNYVYTRVKETDTAFAGTVVMMSSIYLGESASLQDISLDYHLVSYSGADHAWVPQELELDEMGLYSYAKLGNIIEITASPVPSNVTFNGIRGENWLINSSSAASDLGSFYQEPGCTHSLVSDQYYKTVYFRCEKQANRVQIAAQNYYGYNSLAYDSFSLNVANGSGEYLFDSASAYVTVYTGSMVQDYPVKRIPDRAELTGATISYSSGTGSHAPTVTLSGNSVCVDAANATGGYYYYDLYKNGNKISGGVTVQVTTPPVEEFSLSPSKLTVHPGKDYTLTPIFLPAASETAVTWTSSDTNVATVNKGVVTVKYYAEIGETATITATVGDKSATCELTVFGEKFDLEIDGVQVTTKNLDDILGNGVFSYDGRDTLTVSGSYSTAKGLINNYGVDNFTIYVAKDSTLTSTEKAAIITTEATTVTGPGTLTLQAPKDCGIYVPSRNVTLTIQNTTLNAEGKWGVAGPSGTNETELVIDHANVTAKGSDGAICDFGGGITIQNSKIVKPVGGKISSDGKDIVDSSGTVSNDVQIDALLIVLFTMDSDAVVGGKLTVDIEEMANWDEALMEAYLSGEVRYQWYRDGKAIPGADKETLKLTYTEKGTEVYVVVSYGAYRLESEHLNVVFLSNPFTDVSEGKYFFNPVMWAYYHDPQITAGTSKTTFSPNDTCTRAQIVTFLWRAAGSPEPTTTNNPFKDVTSDKYYYRAVLWAAENGITSGTAADKFSPNDGCTRAQVVTFLWRFAGSPEPTTTTNPFTDVPSGKYYTKAVLWAAKKGVTAGTSATTFSPDDTCTRGQIVTFLYRYMEG